MTVSRSLADAVRAEQAKLPPSIGDVLRDNIGMAPTTPADRLRVERPADVEMPQASRFRAARFEQAVPAQYSRATLENFATPSPLLTAKLKLARRYVEEWPARRSNERFPQLVIFFGETGTGKTHLAYAMARAVAQGNECEPTVVSFATVIRELRSTWRRNAGDAHEAQVLQRYHSAPLLVLDEISSHALYGEPWQHLYDVVAPREADLRPTILITNEREGAMETLLGPAISSRVARYGGPWDFGTFDRRRGAEIPRVTHTITTR